jgi:hypothetical protein
MLSAPVVASSFRKAFALGCPQAIPIKNKNKGTKALHVGHERVGTLRRVPHMRSSVSSKPARCEETSHFVCGLPDADVAVIERIGMQNVTDPSSFPNSLI